MAGEEVFTVIVVVEEDVRRVDAGGVDGFSLVVIGVVACVEGLVEAGGEAIFD